MSTELWCPDCGVGVVIGHDTPEYASIECPRCERVIIRRYWHTSPDAFIPWSDVKKPGLQESVGVRERAFGDMKKETDYMKSLLGMRPKTDGERMKRRVAINCIEQSNAADRFFTGSRLPAPEDRRVSNAWAFAQRDCRGAKGRNAECRCCAIRFRSNENQFTSYPGYWSRKARSLRAVKRYYHIKSLPWDDTKLDKHERRDCRW